MCSSLKKMKNNQSGFTLIELAIGIIIIGLILIPAITLYKDFSKNADWTETEENKSSVETEIGGFASNFGRYPCPASMTAARGDVDYGFELANCQTSAPAAGSCSGGICAYTSPNAGRIVLVGALPFKNLNLLEEQAYDGQSMKFTYAVTFNLTDTSTFAVNDGAIGIVSAEDLSQSVITTPNTAHYVVVSHGPNKAGAFSSTNAQIPCTEGSLAEEENCDADTIFATGEITNTFDDRITFFDGVLPTEWKKENAESIDIFLKDSNSIALGASNTDNLDTADTVLVRTIGADTGNAISDTSFFVDRLCELSATGNADCFEPQLLAGALTEDTSHPENRLQASGGLGMSCYDGTNDEFLIGIQNGTPLCSDEVFISCPSGSFVDGVDSDGNLRCDTEPQERCEATTLTNFCGGSASVPNTASGANAFDFSGECRMFPSSVTDSDVIDEIDDIIEDAIDDNPGDFAAAITQARTDIDAELISINLTPRDIEQCEDVTSTPPGLVRDTFRCDDGTWSTLSSHEIRGSSTFPSNVTAGSPWPAENSYTGTDDSNNDHYHDCWCREDYRRVFDSGIVCPSSGETGMRVRIQKHLCPRTDHHWQTIYDERYLFCGCSPGTEIEYVNCNAYYDTVNGTSGTTGLTGLVELEYTTICDGDDNLIRSPTTPTSIDTSQCQCATNPSNFDRDYCPAGQTNSWTSPWGTETGVTAIREQPWICPGTTSGGLPDPGYYGSFATVTGLSIPSCTCDTSTNRERLDCPDGETGLGIFYDAPIDCSTGLTNPDQTTWTEAYRVCTSCEWTTVGAPTTTEFSLGPEPKSTCTCGSPNEDFCSEFSKLGEYNTWSPCQCKPKL